MFQRLTEEVLDGRERGDYGWTAKAVAYEREVREVALYRGVEQDLRPGVAEGRTVLV